MLGATQLESSSAEKELGILVDTKLNMTLQRALAAKKAHGTLHASSLGLPRTRETALELL